MNFTLNKSRFIFDLIDYKSYNINTTDSIIEGHTRKNALIDYGSKIQYQFIKLFTPLKYPEIIHFKVKIKNRNFEGNYHQLFKTFKIKGHIKKIA